jgi:dipeptidyl-peptidase-4
MKHILFLLFLGSTILSLGQQALTLEQAVAGQRSFYPSRTVMFNWIPNTTEYSYLSSDYQTLLRGNIKNDQSSEIITTAKLNELTGEQVQYVAISSWKDAQSFYIQLSNKLFLVNILKQTAEVIAELPNAFENQDLSEVSGLVAYTESNDLYVSSLNGPIEETTEEIVSGQAIARSEFGITKGTFWSNDGKSLAYYQKDEKGVANYPLVNIHAPTGLLESIKYPMAGQVSEESAVGIFNVSTKKLVKIKPRGEAEDYLTNFTWGPKDKFVYIAEVNRGQNHMKLQKYDAATGKFIKTLFEEKNKKWVEPEHPAYFIADNMFIWMSERDGFMNLYLYNTDGKLIQQLTANKWVAKEIIGHDTDGNVYFSGTGEDSRENHYFQVNTKNGKQRQLTKESGTHSVSFSSDYSFMYDAWSSTEVPLKEVIVDVKNGKTKREIATAKNPLTSFVMGKAEYGTIKAADGNTDLNYRLIKPSDFDASKKYPVLVYVYGGPHAQLVTNSWMGGASGWMYWLAEQGYLVYTLDGRGSANRGFEFESVIHRQVGNAEIADQMEGVKYLKSLPYVNPDRLAVHGWSFGGFMTGSLMLRQPGTFNVGVAGGPVTDWKYYEVMYGERYMDQPEENKKGYEESSLMNYVDQLEGKLMLIHGTSDNVVVMQHSMSLIEKFIDAGVQMDFFPYPMHEHNVYGKDRIHLMKKVLDYVMVHNQ